MVEKEVKNKSLLWVAPMVEEDGFTPIYLKILEGLSSYFSNITILSIKSLKGINSKYKVMILDKSFSIEKIDEFDIVIYNINNASFYEKIFELFFKKPKPIILHSSDMEEYLDKYWFEEDEWKKVYNLKNSLDALRPILENTRGVFCHSEELKKYLENNSVGQVGCYLLKSKEDYGDKLYIETLVNFLEGCNQLNLEKQYFAMQLTERLQAITNELGVKPNKHGRDELYLTSISNKIYSILGGVLDDEGEKGIIQRKPSEYDKNKEIPCDAFKTIGLWIGFAKPVPDLHREGLTRFLQFAMKAILERFPNIKLEVWSYSINEEYVKNSFPILLEKESAFANRVSLITEINYKDALCLNPLDKEVDYDITIEKDNLSILACNYSKADIFIPFIQYLDNLIAVEKPIFVPAHDLVTSENYYDFTKTYPHFKAECMNVQWRATNYVRNNAFLFTISKTVRDNQLLRYITQLYEENTHVFYLPVHAKDLSKINFLPFNKLKEKFFPKNFDYKEGSSLKEDRKSYQYLFYPTQIRPYKNIIGILKAMNILKDEFPNLRLVVTGHENDEIKEYVKENKLEYLLIKAIDVTDDELYSLYKYAALIPAASYYEGGFHLQAYEACHIGVPFCVADIPNTRDLLEHLELTVENCGFPIFNPHDEKDIARAIKEQLLKERSKAVAECEPFKKAFQAQTCEKSAEEYYSMMFL